MNPTGEAKNGVLRPDFERRVMIHRTLATPEAMANWSLTSLREKLIKIGARVVSHGRDVTFQMAKVAIPRTLFAEIPNRISALRSPPLTAP